MKKLSKLLLGLILSFMVIQVPLALNHSVYALDDETTEDVITPKSGLMYEDNQFVYYSDGVATSMLKKVRSTGTIQVPAKQMVFYTTSVKALLIRVRMV
ncbi:Uncharacterised protein [Roseburia hominis]|nr:Uncharacterised protein [Roseburia hominis]